jgi:ssDNA-binding Zn-finger/Zn-ribbon topoisomerase 1
MLYLMIFIVIILIFIIYVMPKRQSTNEVSIAYTQIGPLFTKAERSFLGVLNKACGDDAVVFGKVRVADILKPEKGLDRSSWQRAFNRISSKHFDYVLCNPSDLSILSVVELDDSTHTQAKTIKRDKLVEDACASSSLKLHRFKAAHSYNISDVRMTIFPLLVSEDRISGDSSIENPTESIVTPISKACPKCSSELIKKIARKGDNKGNEFLACNAFPKCRYTEDVVN